MIEVEAIETSPEVVEKQEQSFLRRNLLGRMAGGCAIVLSSLSFMSANPAEARADNTLTTQGGIPQCILPTETSTEKKDAKRDRIHVVGNREENGWGRTWIPYGVSIFGGLQDGDGPTHWQPTIAQSMAQIEATPFWHANTVRLQWAESNIFKSLTPGDSVNVPFLKALCQQVLQIRKQGEVVVLNDNTEFPDWGEYNPEQRTIDAWKAIFTEFGNQNGLIYEPFNEPRLELKYAGRKWSPSNINWLWRVWQKGGEVNNKRFIGMQELVDSLRSEGYREEIWLDPPMLEGLNKAEKYPIKDPLHNEVLTFHHASMPMEAVKGNDSDWQKSFGYLTSRYPVVDGEWNQAAAPRTECKSTSYHVVPFYLRYLRSKRIGVLFWSLQAGSMVAEPPGKHLIATNITQPYEPTDPKTLEHPSHMKSNYACDSQRVGEGVGQWALNYMRKYSRP